MCAHTFVYVTLLIENSADCVMENCRLNNVDPEEREKEGQGEEIYSLRKLEIIY